MNVSFTPRFAVFALLLLLPGGLPGADDYFPPSDSAGGWRTLKDAVRIEPAKTRIFGLRIGAF